MDREFVPINKNDELLRSDRGLKVRGDISNVIVGRDAKCNEKGLVLALLKRSLRV